LICWKPYSNELRRETDVEGDDTRCLHCGETVVCSGGLDVGPQSLQRFAEVISSAQTIFWNGSMGVFELEPFRQGTLQVAAAVAACPGTTIVGGGDTVAALELTDCRDKITHVSTGGGASLEFLEGKALPGIACLNERTYAP
jgi:phosphoglycerate kinase